MSRDASAGVPTRTLGRSGLTVSRVGLGLAALGRPGYLNVGHGADLPDTRVEGMRAHAHRMLDAALDAGITYVDAARSYGLAEAFVASWPRVGEVTVASKWGYTYTAGWAVRTDQHEVKDHSLAALRRQHEETDAVLGAHLALYQVHSATLDTGVLADAAVHRRLAALPVPVGLSVTGPRQADAIRAALQVEVDGVALFATVQATWNLLEPSVGPALAEAHAAGLGVIVKEAVANGRLTPRGDPPPAMAALAEAHGVGVDAVAIAAVLAQPFVDVVLSGAATIPQLRSNLAALDLPMAATVSEDLQVREPAQRYWATRAALSWT